MNKNKKINASRPFLVCLNQASPNYPIKECSTPRKNSNASVRGQTWRLGMSRGVDNKLDTSFLSKHSCFPSLLETGKLK